MVNASSGSASSPEPLPEKQLPTSEPKSEQSLLDEVLRQTQKREDDRDTADRAVWGRLLKVAERHRGAPFGVEPVLVEMVEASLQSRFNTDDDPARWREICFSIAQTLYDDPASHERLGRFWNRLARRA